MRQRSWMKKDGRFISELVSGLCVQTEGEFNNWAERSNNATWGTRRRKKSLPERHSDKVKDWNRVYFWCNVYDSCAPPPGPPACAHPVIIDDYQQKTLGSAIHSDFLTPFIFYRWSSSKTLCQTQKQCRWRFLSQNCICYIKGNKVQSFAFLNITDCTTDCNLFHFIVRGSWSILKSHLKQFPSVRLIKDQSMPC